MKIRIALMLSVLLVAALAGPATANDRKVRFERVEQRLVSVELSDLTTFVLPDGTSFTEDELEENEPEGPPPVGTKIYFTEDLFQPDDDTEPSGDPIGRSDITCETLLRDDIRCAVDVRIFDKGDLHHTVLINFEEQFESEDDDFVVDLAITGGTGAFAGAGGQTTISERDDFDESGVSFYDLQAIVPEK